MIQRFVEVNRYWLLEPGESIQNFSYTMNRIGGTQEFQVTDPAKTPRAKVQGVTYSALLQQIARAPESATIREINEESGRVRLVLGFKQAVRAAVGNGVEGSWNGYHSFGGEEGFVMLDSQRWVPLEAQLGKLHERFDEFVRLDDDHYVPLKIQIDVGESSYLWRFRVYEPGLWLFDDSFSGERRLAWTEKVKVNGSPGKVQHASEASVALEQSARIGQKRLEEFLNANRHWLLPSLEARRGLVYEYRQETPYLERVCIDSFGNILARQESTKESPDKPGRQTLWLADGRSYTGNASDAFVQLAALQNPNPSSPLPPWPQRDRLPQHVVMALALDCGLTRLAREPNQFRAEVKTVPNHAEQYLLVLHPKRDARLFSGTMLAFTSWCYMHDVSYDRSDILCDRATHRPIEEKDYAGTALKGHYWFENWLDNTAAYPGAIRALVPFEKEGKDQSLEMTAHFGFARPELWLLQRVESHFRGTGDGSTGLVNVVATDANVCPEIDALLEQAKATKAILGGVQDATDEGIVSLSGEHWTPFYLKASWAEEARQAARDRENKQTDEPMLGVYRARLSHTNGAAELLLEGVSTANWKEFRTAWKLRPEGEQGATIPSDTTNLNIRGESGPTPFTVRLPLAAAADSSVPKRFRISATVERMTGMYHGHGMWMTFADKK